MINDPFIINTEKKKTYLRKIFEKKKQRRYDNQTIMYLNLNWYSYQSAWLLYIANVVHVCLHLIIYMEKWKSLLRFNIYILISNNIHIV